MSDYIYDNERTIPISIDHDGTAEPDKVYTIVNEAGDGTKQMYVRNFGIAQMKLGEVSYEILIDDKKVGQGELAGSAGITTAVTFTANELNYFTEADGVGTYGFPLRDNQTVKVKITSTDAAHDAAVSLILWKDE